MFILKVRTNVQNQLRSQHNRHEKFMMKPTLLQYTCWNEKSYYKSTKLLQKKYFFLNHR